MPRGRTGKSKKFMKNSGGAGLKFGDTGPGMAVVKYGGPSRLPSSVDPEIKTVELHNYQLVTLPIGTPSVLDLNVSSSTARTLASDFLGWAGLYREYRVLAIRAEFHPVYKNSPPPFSSNVTAPQPMWTVVDRDDASAVGAYANILSNTSLRIFALNEPWKREAKMASTEEADFIAVTASPTAFFDIKLFTTSGIDATLATNLGHLYAFYVVQFRTRI